MSCIFRDDLKIIPAAQLEPGETRIDEFGTIQVPLDKDRILEVRIGPEVVTQVIEDLGLEDLMKGFIQEVGMLHLAIIDESGSVLFSASNQRGRNKDLPDDISRRSIKLLQGKGDTDIITADDVSEMEGVGVISRMHFPGYDNPVALFIEHPIERFENVLSIGTTYIVVVGVVMMLLAILLSMWLGRRLTRPLHALAEDVKHFGQGNLDYRITRRLDKELHQLAEAFNTMATDIETYTRDLGFETRRRERMESDLRIGAEIQRSLLPETPPVLDGVTLAGWSRAAREVGGDFYDFLHLDDGRLAIAIGDASGKGLPAALLVTECSSALRAIAPNATSPADVLNHLNQAMYTRFSDSGLFVTLFYMVIDAKTGLVEYANGGHNPPLCIQQPTGTTVQLEGGDGMPLGVANTSTYNTHEYKLNFGDAILLYTDGITDALSTKNTRFGTEALLASLQSCAPHKKTGLLETVRNAVDAHTGSEEPFDDMTLVSVHFES